eukprot:TRINITY_DN80651_c0_g1_i1.p1 TRINITY_DN80651_c0_g1~~TRINITY_DN80651_c0_g1_i1.p1  ORF type:complete len:409 (+),score=70.63 TRINITY_DN80651_c0_g1_i1:37-1263(+)
MDECSWEERCASCGCYVDTSKNARIAKQYCSYCWSRWLQTKRRQFLDRPLKAPVRYSGAAVRDFSGSTVHVLQIGLGTYGNFVQPTVHWLRTLLEACSRQEDEPLTAIGVDPVQEVVGTLEEIVTAEDEAKMSLLLGAVSDKDGKLPVFCLPSGARQQLRDAMEHHPDEYARVEVDMNLAYLENMSTVGELDDGFKYNVDRICELSGWTGNLIEKRLVDVYTFEGILKRHNAKGCEVLIIDAEGCDCAILRSAIEACKKGHCPWPRVIRFETRNDATGQSESCREEDDVLLKLQTHSYAVVDVGGDATLLLTPALRASAPFAAWADHNFPLKCHMCGWELLPSSPSFSQEVSEGLLQWKFVSFKDQNVSGKHRPRYGNSWRCSSCFHGESARKRQHCDLQEARSKKSL